MDRYQTEYNPFFPFAKQVHFILNILIILFEFDLLFSAYRFLAEVFCELSLFLFCFLIYSHQEEELNNN